MHVQDAVTRRSFLRRAAILGGAAALAPVGACDFSDNDTGRSGAPSGDRRTRHKPNIVVILADDMRYDEAAFMPYTSRLMTQEGVAFTAARHNISLCSPARAGFLTGQYSTRHGVRSQLDSIPQERLEATLPVWLQDAGYQTGLIGKYFTAYHGRSTPPGWNTRRQLADNSQFQFGFTVWDGNRVLTPDVDQTRYLRSEVVDFLATTQEPFFLWFTPTANHTPYQSPPGYEGEFADLQWPDLREDDVSDKPPWVQALPSISDEQLEQSRANQRNRLRELLGLDGTVADMLRMLEERQILDNTIVLFSSDNGILQGEHRIPQGWKNLPYEPSVRVPCMLRAPGLGARVVRQPVHMAVDLTATCVDVAGAVPDHSLDGVSLLDVIDAPDRYDARRLLYERDNRDDSIAPPAEGVFTRTRKLIRYSTAPATYELYDLERDPDELDNVAGDSAYAAERAELEDALDELLSS
jgi:N-acetylglucosamine-6-sulfatase